MIWDQLREDITTRFQQGFVDLTNAPLLPIEYPNHAANKVDGEPWGRLAIRYAGRHNAAVGKGFQRTIGIVFLQVFTPENMGTKAAASAGEKMVTMFENQSLTMAGGGIEFRTVELDPVGKTQDGMHQTTITVEFQHDYISA